MALDYHPDHLWELIYWLPDDSAFQAAQRGGREYLGWDSTRTFAALQLEQTQYQRYEFIAANSEKGKAGPPPEPVYIPGREEAQREKELASNPFAAMFAAQAAYVEQQRDKAGQVPPGG